MRLVKSSERVGGALVLCFVFFNGSFPMSHSTSFTAILFTVFMTLCYY